MGLDTWTSYSLSDFLLFSDRVYWRMFETYNQALWPGQLATLAAGLLLIAGLIRPGPTASRLMFLALAGAWAWIAWAFLAERYLVINWAVAYVIPLFCLQAGLLAGAALWPKAPALSPAAGASGAAIVAALSFAVAGYPFLVWVAGQSLQSGEVFGVAPDPTTVATIAVLALWPSRNRWLLMIVPVAWCLATGLTLYALAAPHFFAAPLLALAILLANLLDVEPNPPRQNGSI